jgi:hypothetical protein
LEIEVFAKELLNNFAVLEYQGTRIADTIAKSYDYNPERNLLDQSMWDHIRSGIDAFLSLYKYVQDYDLPLEEEELKIALVAYVLHDLHKNEMDKHGSSEYGLPLDELEFLRNQLCKDLDIDVNEIPPEFIRVAAVSSFSNKMGDFSQLPYGYDWVHMYHWVKLMDQTASITSIAECRTGNSLKNLAQVLRMVFPPKFTEQMDIRFHFIQEMRGLVTSLMHQGMGEVMKESGYYPWLRFGDGTIYLTFEPEELPDPSKVVEQLTDYYFQTINFYVDNINLESLFDRATFKCQTLAFILYNKPQEFAELFYKLFLKGGGKKFPTDKFSANQLKQYGVKTVEQLYEKMGIHRETNEDFIEKWFYTARYFAALQRLNQRVRGKKGHEAIEELAHFLELTVREVPTSLQSNNRRFDEAIWLAYDYLTTALFEGQKVSEVPTAVVRQEVKLIASRFLQGKIDQTIVKNIVDDEMKIIADLKNYIGEQLLLSWENNRNLNLLDEKDFFKPRNRTQKNICNICNRQILGDDKKVRAPVIQDDIQVFSNRLLPKESNVSALHWCSLCAFEYIMRQVMKMDSDGDKNYSRRIYLFAVPSFQLTDDRLIEMQEDLQKRYMAIRVHHRKKYQAWQDIFLSNKKETLREGILDYLELYHEYYERELEERGRPPSTGDSLKGSLPNNIMLFAYDCYSGSIERTREEAWMKALTAAITLHKLYGFRVFLTEKPFLMLTDVREIRYAIHLDAPPYKVARWVQQIVKKDKSECAIPIESVSQCLYYLAHLWEVHQTVHPYDRSKPTDKQVSTVLHQLEVHGVPGAYFFKRYLSNDNNKLTDAFFRSCQGLNQSKGGRMMGLSEEIAKASLELYSPSTKRSGRAFRLENLYRTIVKGIRERRDLSELKGLVLKRLERLAEQANGYVPLPIDLEKVDRLVELVYEEFFQKECQGSLAKLSHKENQLADGIYFESYRLIKEKFKEVDQDKQNEKEED